jgi:hypothetical protein
MFKSILAIAAGAACAGIVAVAPPLVNAMAATQSVESGAPTQGAVVAEQHPDGSCLQHWPYYERSCLRDARLPSGSERVVRVIAVDRPSKY